MKSLRVILSILVLCLSLMPCEDTITQSVKNITSRIIATNNQDHHEDDVCSPFCVCTCCTTSSITLIANTSVYIPFEVKFAYAGHLVEKFITVHLPVWQPPQQA